MKYKWTRYDNLIVSLCFIGNIDINIVKDILPQISLNSIKMKYANCLYLQQGNVTGSLTGISKTHEETWHLLNNIIKKELENKTKIIEDNNKYKDNEIKILKKEIEQLKKEIEELNKLYIN